MRAFLNPFLVGVGFPARWFWVSAGVRSGVGVLGGGRVCAGGGSFRGVDERVQAGGSSRGRVVVAVEVEAVQALQVAPVIAHREREARALHGARAGAAGEGLRARHRTLSPSSRAEVDGDLWWTPVFITIVVLHIVTNHQ